MISSVLDQHCRKCSSRTMRLTGILKIDVKEKIVGLFCPECGDVTKLSPSFEVWE